MSELLTIQEQADRLRVKPSWLYQFTRLKGASAIPHLKVGKYIRFREEEVLAWLRARQGEKEGH